MTARLPPEEVVEILTKRVAALESQRMASGDWAEHGRLTFAIQAAQADLEIVEEEINQLKA